MAIPPPRRISSLHLGSPRAIVQIHRPRAQIAGLISAQNSQSSMSIYWLQDAKPVRPSTHRSRSPNRGKMRQTKNLTETNSCQRRHGCFPPSQGFIGPPEKLSSHATHNFKNPWTSMDPIANYERRWPVSKDLQVSKEGLRSHYPET